MTQWFPPEPITPPLWIAQALASRGCDVRVLTGVPNFPSGRTVAGYRASRGLSEVVEDFEVLRAPLYPDHGASTVKRAANYLSWATSASAFGSSLLAGADVSLVYSSPATAAIPAMVSRHRSGTPYVLLVQDVWPDSITATGFADSRWKRRLVNGAVGRFASRAYDRAAHIAVTSPGMRDLLCLRGVEPGKVSLVYNWVDEAVFHPAAPEPGFRGSLGLENAFVLMYAGNHGAAQALDVVVRAIGRLGADSNVHLVMVGSGVEKAALQQLAGRVASRRVHFVDAVAPARIPAVMSSADVQLVSLRDDALFEVTMPSKVQSVMACGRATIVIASGDAGRAVSNAGAGWHVPAGSERELVATIDEASRADPCRLDAMGNRARAYYGERMSESINGARLARILESAAQPRERHD